MSSKRPSYHPPLFGSDIRDITYSWKPSPAAKAKVTALGIDTYTISNQLRTEFILHCETEGLRAKNYNPLFVAYAQEQYGSTTTELAETKHAPANRNQHQGIAPFSPGDPPAQASNIMTDDWQPSANMLEYILAMVCPNQNYIQAQLISFSSHYHGKTHPNWDQQFKKWINQGWNVYQNKNNYKDADNKDFVEKHTDTSWSDGL